MVDLAVLWRKVLKLSCAGMLLVLLQLLEKPDIFLVEIKGLINKITNIVLGSWSRVGLLVGKRHGLLKQNRLE